jgi:iron complex transport system ATP-binding protein
MNSSSATLLECVALDIDIGGKKITRDLNLRIEAGQCWCILGRNGSGKTTLLHTLAGLRPARQGRIYINGLEQSSLSRRQIAQQLGILFQTHTDSFPSTVLEHVMQGRHPHLRAWQWESTDDKNLALAALEQLGLSDLRTRNTQTLSGGERQRVAIATLLTQQTALLLLDEPSNHLDLHHRLSLLDNLVANSKRAGQAVLMSLHDINLAARFADHALLLLGNGNVAYGPVAEVLNSQQLEALYGHPLEELRTAAGRAWLPL